MIDDEKTQEQPEPPAPEAASAVQPPTEPLPDAEADDDEDAAAEEEVSSNQAEPLIDDPMGEAYDLEHGSRLDEHPDPTALPWQTDVKSPKEFFSTEILYRFDILEDDEQRAIAGTYRIELKGAEGGIWTITVGEEFKVQNSREDADIVLSMQLRDFLNLINGQLNPQLAVLSQKMKITGDLRRALAFQEILTPSPD